MGVATTIIRHPDKTRERGTDDRRHNSSWDSPFS